MIETLDLLINASLRVGALVFILGVIFLFTGLTASGFAYIVKETLTEIKRIRNRRG